MSRWRHPNHREPSELPAELRRTTVPGSVRDWVVRELGTAVISVRRLPGASSTAVHELRLADGRPAVLRRYVWDGFLRDEPDAPTREAQALEYASRHRLPAPAALAIDVDGERIGDGVPAILMTRLPGRAHASPDVGQLAETAVRIHEVSGERFGHMFFYWCRDTSTRPPTGCRDPDTWWRALEIWRTQEPFYEPRLVHRDFHPGNVLWSRGKLTGVVDWANACVGPPGIDIATCRWNLADWAGVAASEAFVASYEAVTGHRHDRYWDIAAILEDDWDLIDSPDRVTEAERFLSLAMREWDG